MRPAAARDRPTRQCVIDGHPPFAELAILFGLALGAGDRTEALIGLAVPGRPIRSLSRRTGAP